MKKEHREKRRVEDGGAGGVLAAGVSCVVAVGADACLPWLGTLLCDGATLEEATRPNLLVFICAHLFLSLPLLLKSRIRPPTIALGVVGGSGLFYAVAVLFGAPLLSKGDQTLLWAILMAVLAVLPLATAGFSLDSPLVWRGWLNNDPREVVAVLGALGAMLGAWVGAFSVPLDWDRPWQPFPIASTYAALWGHAISHALALIYLLLIATLTSHLHEH